MDSTFLYGANVHANGIRQHYLRFGGAGRPLIVVPGITSPAVTWGFVAERLGRSCDTYVLDVRGRGLSQTGADLDYSVEAMASDVTELATALGLKDCALLGHSMGARIVARAARRDSSRLSRAALIDPPVSGPGRRPYPIPLSWYLDVIRQARRGFSFEEMPTYNPHWETRHLRLRAEWLPTCDQTAVETAYRGFHEDSFHDDLPHIGVPTLLVVAGKGGVILPDDIAEIRALAPKVAIEEAPNCGHMIPWDDFEVFFRAIGPFLGLE